MMNPTRRDLLHRMVEAKLSQLNLTIDSMMKARDALQFEHNIIDTQFTLDQLADEKSP